MNNDVFNNMTNTISVFNIVFVIMFLLGIGFFVFVLLMIFNPKI